MNRGCSLVRRMQALRLRTLELAVLLVLLTSVKVPAADRNPFSGDPKAAKAGEFEFCINCAFCHGLGARGGGRGPDLTHAQKRHGSSDGDMFQNISNGIPGTAMPANGTNGQGVGMTDEEIWQIITYLRSIEVKAPSQPDPRQAILLWRCELFLVPHVRRQGRASGAGPYRRRSFANRRSPDRIRPKSQPETGLGIDGTHERVCSRVRNRNGLHAGWKADQGRCFQRRQLQPANDGRKRENSSARKRQSELDQEEPRILDAGL